MNNEVDDIYCSNCGACGESGCCSPDKCLYVDHYNKEYRELLEEHERFLILLQALTDTSGEYSRADQIADADALLKELGYK